MILAQNHVTRLSRYKRVLLQLKQAGLQQVFANNLADAAGMTSTQVRKDFSVLGIFGQKKGGYEVDKLLLQLESLLGLTTQREIILIGCGRMGSAIMDFPEFQTEQIKIKAAFDVDEQKQNSEAAIPIFPVTELEAYLQQHPINLAILAVPGNAAQAVTDELVQLGICGILNLTSRYVHAPENIYINNIDLTMALEAVIFHTPLVKKASFDEKD